MYESYYNFFLITTPSSKHMLAERLLFKNKKISPCTIKSGLMEKEKKSPNSGRRVVQGSVSIHSRPNKRRS